MSMTDSGKGECDRCGTGIGNAGVTEAIVVGDLDPANPGMVRNLHFCRENGCASKVLSARNMEHYDKVRAPKAVKKTAAKKASKQ